MMRPTICRTQAVQKGNCQSAWSKTNSPWSNSPKWWGRPTTVRSTSGRKSGSLGSCRRSIGPFRWGRTVRNSFKMDPCTGRRRLKLFWYLLKTSCWLIISTMLNRFGGSGLGCYRRYVHGKFERRGKMESQAKRDRRRSWGSRWPNRCDGTSPGCQIQRSLLWCGRC